MGLPLETSRGCSENCMFCMVLIMQAKNYHFKSIDQLKIEIPFYKNKFINVIDYNIGVNKPHLLAVSKLIQESEALGWMAEMNIEMLDDDEIIEALSKSRCRVIYCGLETVDIEALKSVNKDKTNIVSNYKRIIQKVQRRGLNIAAGLIIGLEGADEKSYKKTIDFFIEMNISYIKITYLIYNPGTKVNQYMSKKGTYTTFDFEKYDGNNLTFLPHSVSEEMLNRIVLNIVKDYYSTLSIFKRAYLTSGGVLNKLETLFFNYCYRQPYLDWFNKENLIDKKIEFNKLLEQPYKKSFKLYISEKILNLIRKIRMKYE
jgi:radical SAM superfamily enzyme YgiQ (UPF0313 family)